ncbi:MAG: phytanoyl-CoA dioxygenase family protein [Alphaproteobacteria bacterium]|nr:phytanoyl-CoA dioxygenase family protein [Alphaproteobacteria bacterium]
MVNGECGVSMKDNSYNFESKSDPLSIVDNLNVHGIAMVRGFLDAGITSTMKHRVAGWIDEDSMLVIRSVDHPTNPDGRQVFVSPDKAAENGEPELVNIFREGLVRSVAEEFFSPNDSDLNPEILLTHLRSSPTAILPWHFDRMQSLKFWVYLEDSTKDDGAFKCCPGTHWEGRYRAAYYMATGTAVHDIPNDVPDHRIRNPVTQEASAGDLIIFDPDGFHRGGVVKPGHERKVVRADTFPVNARRYADKPFTGGWWLRSGLNLSKWFKRSGSRILGDRTRDTAVVRERRSSQLSKFHSRYLGSSSRNSHGQFFL